MNSRYINHSWKNTDDTFTQKHAVRRDVIGTRLNQSEKDARVQKKGGSKC